MTICWLSFKSVNNHFILPSSWHYSQEKPRGTCLYVALDNYDDIPIRINKREDQG
jgi:hypothetical protein